MINPQGGFVRVNPQFLEVSGYSNEEINSIPVLNLFEGEGKNIIAQRMQEVFETGDSSAEAEFLTKSGNKIPYFFSGHRTVIDGQMYLVGLGSDITFRKQVETSLQQQLLFSNALNKISEELVEQVEPGLIFDNTARIVGETLGADRSLIYKFACDKQQVIGLSEWLNPNYQDITSSIATYPLEVFSGGVDEMRRTRSWFSSHSNNINPNLLNDGSGELLHNKKLIKSLLWYPFAFRNDEFYALVLNQTHTFKVWTKEEIGFLDSVSQLTSIALEKIRLMEERKIATNDLRISATAFEVQEAMMITDADNLILRVNSTFTNITGYATEEVVGKNPHILSSGRHDNAFYEAMWKSSKYPPAKPGALFCEPLKAA